ncbi:MAG: ABC transporter [Dehalococcoidia bacterium]|nr:ABC transporter [Dehalococcoidia bacterium]
MNAIKRIFGIALKYHKKRLMIGYLTVLGAAASGLGIPLVIRSAVDDALSSENATRALLNIGIILILLGLCRGLFAWSQTAIAEGLSQKIAYRIRNEYYDKLQNLSFAFHDKQATGSLMSRATADVEGVRMFINMGVVRSLFILLMTLGASISMLLLDLQLALVTLAFIPFLAFRAVISSRRLRRMWMKVQEMTADMVATLQESLSGVRVIKAFAAEEHEKLKFKEKSEPVAEQTYLAESTWAKNFAIMNFGFMLAMTVILWFGGSRVIDGRELVDGIYVYNGLTPGELVAFFVYMNMMIMPVRMMGWTVNTFSRAASSGERIFEILDTVSPVRNSPDSVDAGRVRGEVVFDNVSFTYGEGTEALKSIDVHAPAGSTVALVGRPGSGKTTFAHLIPRFYDATEGKVTVDGMDVRSFTLDSLRSNVGVVQQDVFIHTASIRDNIAYGSHESPTEDIEEVTRAAQMHDFIADLPEAYETVVGERGVGLSGGQKQRLSIARTILLDPPILILDDSTSSVDVHTERLIQDALDKVVTSRTTFLISNRFSVIAKADQILVFKNGEITQRGKHEELLEEQGEYRELYDYQMRAAETNISEAAR